MRVFFRDADYEAYRRLLLEQVNRHEVSVWTYSLMPNHIHLIASPADSKGLAAALAEAHRRYAVRTNAEHGWRGHLWQERFWSFPLEEVSLPAVVRYVLLNPVRAGLVRRAVDWEFSSARAHLGLRRDPLIADNDLTGWIGDWERLLNEKDDDTHLAQVRSHSSSGRPLGSEGFVARLERLLGRRMRAEPPGRPRKCDPVG